LIFIDGKETQQAANLFTARQHSLCS